MSPIALSLFTGMILFAAFGNVLTFWMFGRLRSVGVRVKWFANFGDLRKALRQYSQIAPVRGWPTWPVPAFWLAIAGMFLMLLPLMTQLGGRTPVSSIPRPLFFLAWVSLASLILAVWFTRRLIRKIPRNQTGTRDWKLLLHDEYVRNDAYAAILGWVGPFLAWLAYSRLR